MAARPGKTAPRLIEDLLNYDPRYEEGLGRNILSDSPPHFEDGRYHGRAVPLRSCRHALLTKDDQSILPEAGQRPDVSKTYKIASFCSECRFHFDITADFRAVGYYSSACPNQENPLHQLIYVPDKDDEGLPVLGGPKFRTYKFLCTAKECPMELSIRVRPPQFRSIYVDLLTNRTRLQARLAAAKQADPQREDLTAAAPVESLDYLRTYLRDSLDMNRTKSRIPMRNKKFMVAFGQDCDDMLRELGFARGSVENDEAFWSLPDPPPRIDPLEEDTLRTKIEDVRAELRVLISKRPETEREKSSVKASSDVPYPSLNYIKRMLGCIEYSTTPSRRAVDHSEEEHPHYASLGATGDFSDDLIAFAYDRQVECDSENASYYFECLEGIAKGRNSEVLQVKVATLMSAGQTNRRQVEEAYRYLGIDPSKEISDEHIIGLFKARLSDVSPTHENEMREMLRIIGQARGSHALTQEASNAVETYSQALAWLGLDEDTADEFVTTMVTVKIGENVANRDIARKAVEIIAENRNSDSLRSWLRTGELAGSKMDLAEAYRILGIQDRTADIQDEEVLNLQREVAEQDGREPREKIQEAFQLIWVEKFAGRPTAGNAPSRGSETWPVGLQNIGNTCYLNSALQFFFAIKPLRNWVLNFKESHIDFDLDTDLMRRVEEKRVGGRFVTIEEVKEGQELVVELKKLFKNMIEAPGTSVRPSSRLPCLAFKKENAEQLSPVLPGNNDSSAPLGTQDGLPLQGPLPPPSMLDADQELGDCSNGPTDSKSETTLNGEPSVAAAHGSEPSSASEDSGVEIREVSQSQKPAPPKRRPPPPPPRPGEIPGWVKSAARQQDAAEVMDNMTHLLQCAALPEDIINGDRPGNQVRRFIEGDKTTTLVTERTNGEASSESRQDPFTSLIVDVLLRQKTIYSALHDELDRTDIIDEGTKPSVSNPGGIKVRRTYNSIRTPPPILQVHCKRVDFDKKTGNTVRSDRSLRLEDILYLDRFLESPKSISAQALFERRLQFWQWQQQLVMLQSRLDELADSGIDMGPTEDLDLASATEEAAKFLLDIKDSQGNCSDGLEPNDLSGMVDGLPETLVEQAQILRDEKNAIESNIAELEAKMDAQFQDLKSTPYRLHSIFIHRGGVSGGHYFVYIRDFKDDTWRQYNDEHVSEAEEEQLAKAMGLVQSSDSSTNIVYVRDDLKGRLTEAVCRHIVQPEILDTQMEDVTVINGVEV